MQIRSSHITPQSKNTQAQAAPPREIEQSAVTVADVVEFGTDFAKGAVPMYGAYKNLEASLTAGIFGASTKSNIAGLGVLANLAGVISLGVGLTGGGTHATLAGAGLLVASGVTHAAAWT